MDTRVKCENENRSAAQKQQVSNYFLRDVLVRLLARTSFTFYMYMIIDQLFHSRMHF